MSTINANDSGSATDDRSLNRHNQSMTNTQGRSANNNTSKPYIPGSNGKSTRNQTAWNNKEQRDGKISGDTKPTGGSSGYNNRDSSDLKAAGYPDRRNKDTRNTSYTKYSGQNSNRDAKAVNYGARDNNYGRTAAGGKPFSPGNKEYKGKKPYGTYGKDSYGGGNGFHKDDDYDENNQRRKGYSSGGQRSDGKAKGTRDKEKEPQSDKLETVRRLEKEKKALERKSQELEKEKQSKPQLKKKRTSNVDWTKGYAKGLYGDDDEEDYSEYF